MKNWIVLVAFLSLSIEANAQWTHIDEKDEFTDEAVQFALWEDEEHRIQISHQGTAVWMFISRKKVGSFEPDGITELRVDQNEVRRIDPVEKKQLARLIGKQTYQWEPGTIGFLIWHGLENEGCGYISELIAGRELKIRYQINSLERDTFKVNLSGSRKALIGGLGLEKCGR